MARIAGDNSTYQFRMMRNGPGGALTSTPYGFELPSVTTIISATIPKPFSAGAWYGYRMALEGVSHEFTKGGERADFRDAAVLESRLSAAGHNPNQSLELSRNRGQSAHDVLELLATGQGAAAQELADKERKLQETSYGQAVLKWWDEKGKATKWKAEQPVFSLAHKYAGTADLISKDTIADLKSHKPQVGFTKEGKGPAYLSDLIQCRAYAMAWEEMGNKPPTKSLIIIARANGQYLEDERTVSEELWLNCLSLYKELQGI